MAVILVRLSLTLSLARLLLSSGGSPSTISIGEKSTQSGCARAQRMVQEHPRSESLRKRCSQR